ncbi:MAG: dTMP kinase [Alphaproteobacteria bacterium]
MQSKTHNNFITFEGGEGAGKSTQINALADFLKSQGREVVITREPGGTPIAEMLRDIIVKNHNHDISPETELGILTSARLNHLEQLIIPALESGKYVLCDRYIDSTYVYQGFSQGLPLEQINDAHSSLMGDKFIMPIKTFFIDVDVETGLSRSQGDVKGEDRFENKDISFHQSVRNGFVELANKYTDRIIKIDGNCDLETVKQEILNKAKDLV